METPLRMHPVLLWRFVDWRKKTVEMYELDYEGKLPKYYLQKTITEENKEELQLLHFPKIKITFDELFEEID